MITTLEGHNLGMIILIYSVLWLLYVKMQICVQVSV